MYNQQVISQMQSPEQSNAAQQIQRLSQLCTQLSQEVQRVSQLGTQQQPWQPQVVGVQQPFIQPLSSYSPVNTQD